MIIADIFAGLGNQLFQYAAARRLAHVHQTGLKLDTYSFSQDKFRRYGLGYFNISAGIATTGDLARLCRREALMRTIRGTFPAGMSNFLVQCINRGPLRSPYRHRSLQFSFDRPAPPLMMGRVASERFYHFDAELLSCPDNVCLSGFWQSEKYFKDISDIIRREFTVKTPLAGRNETMAREMQNTVSVSLHVRRGDKAVQAHHQASTMDFCKAAMKFLQSKLPSPTFYVFTDDWAWVRENLPPGERLVYADHNNDETNYEDLRLMSLCKHNIIGPSSFSWWGAWLNANPGKIVIRPRILFNMSNHDTKDYCPADWVILD